MAGNKYTPETVDAVCYGITLGMTETHAAEYAGISLDTMGIWKKRHSAFSERLREARAKRRALWLETLQKAGDKDWRAIADLLDRCEPDYRKKSEMALTGSDGGPIQIIEPPPRPTEPS